MGTRPALRGVTAFPAFLAHETRKLNAQPIKKIMAAVKVSIVAPEQSESAWLPSVRLNYPITQWLRRLHKFRIQSANNESHRVLLYLDDNVPFCPR
jgi:16S rRNA U1498 N3-methylase RsmE